MSLYMFYFCDVYLCVCCYEFYSFVGKFDELGL